MGIDVDESSVSSMVGKMPSGGSCDGQALYVRSPLVYDETVTFTFYNINITD